MASAINASQREPEVQQALKILNAFVGVTWNPSGREFYVSGGVDDVVHVFELVNGQWTESPKPIALDHKNGLGKDVKPMVGGVAVNASGTRLLAVNYENDSVSIIDLKTRQKTAELDLRPGKIDPAKKGVPGGEYPYWAMFKGDDKAYVSSLRDREIVVLDLHAKPAVAGRIKLSGQPNKLILNRAQDTLFAAVDNSDAVAVIDTDRDSVVASISTTAPPALFPNRERFRGSNPNSLALSPDEHTLYVTNGGTNSVAVIKLAADLRGSKIQGLIPTGWYPNSVSLNRDGSQLYIVNGKSIPGANPRACLSTFSYEEEGSSCSTEQQFVWQLEKGGLLIVPRPDAEELERLEFEIVGSVASPVLGPAGNREFLLAGRRK